MILLFITLKLRRINEVKIRKMFLPYCKCFVFLLNGLALNDKNRDLILNYRLLTQ